MYKMLIYISKTKQFKEADSNQNGKIEFSEFLGIMRAIMDQLNLS